MSIILVIVESPGKIKKIGEYLNSLGDGNQYIVKASMGHCRDLRTNELSIDIDNNYKPIYSIKPGRQRTINELKQIAQKSSRVILAADEDREGEMIASSLKDLLKLKDYDRIVFNEITKTAIKNAIANPTKINDDMVDAQQARRLLDRLVGYKISPLLWKKIKGKLSAGRVQSVVVKIIIDKEKEISDSISNPYFKTSAKFEYKKFRFNGTLNTLTSKLKNIYQFENKESADIFMKSINSDDEFTVANVSCKDSIRRASAPFTTSTLQQDASTKLRFNVKRTMDAAQKLYEAGMITYMRTDSTNLSQQAINDCKDYILKSYGKDYSDPKNHNKKKSKGAQEAHEAVRPTKITVESANGRLSSDCERLYKLIRNRTLASQMANAVIEIQTLNIDLISKDKKSKLPKDTLFVSQLQNVKFKGYLILYNNNNDDDDDDSSVSSGKKEGKLSIKVGKKIKYKQLTINEEYSKLPYRYNEAGLVKYLEKNGIGRPSTYASIISNIVDRNYVIIKNVEGTSKKSEQFTLTKSKDKIKISVLTKDIVIGKENIKLCPTHTGELVNNFMVENFKPIMDIEFTAKFEKYLDKIASGKAKWVNVLDKFYKMFSPMVKQINDSISESGNAFDECMGEDDEGNSIFKGSGKYGPYVKIMEDNKWKYSSIENLEKITLEKAIDALQFPKLLGTHNKANVVLHKGRYGLYIKCSNKTLPIKDENLKIKNIDITYAKKLLDSGDPYSLKSFKLKDKTINVKKGPYGLYAQILIPSKGKIRKKNVSIPDEVSIEDLTLENLINIIGYKRSNDSNA